MANEVERSLKLVLEMPRQRVEQKMETILDVPTHSNLVAAMQHLVSAGGKRLRAVLPWMVADAFDNGKEAALDIGATLELIHTFTLIHDDIMDDDDTRRGLPAVHVQWDQSTGINSGDAMFALAFGNLGSSAAIPSIYLPELVNWIGGMVHRIAEGQQEDMEFEKRADVTEEDYLRMIGGKTAALFEVAALCGGLVAGASAEVVSSIGEWGRIMGLLFQISDDMIDVETESDSSGKPQGSDLIQGKQTLIVIHALNGPDSEAKTILKECLGAGVTAVDDGRLTKAIQALTETGSLEYCRSMVRDLQKSAHSILDDCSNVCDVTLLREFTDTQVNRVI